MVLVKEILNFRGTELSPRNAQVDLFKKFISWAKEFPAINAKEDVDLLNAVGCLGTGVGKTLAACMCIAGYLSQHSGDQVLYVTHRRVLYENGLNALKTYLPYLKFDINRGTLETSQEALNGFYRIADTIGDKKVQIGNCNVVCATIEGLTMLKKKRELSTSSYTYDPKLVVIDEAHHFTEDSEDEKPTTDLAWSLLCDTFPDAKFLYLTASPLEKETFSFDKSLGCILADYPRIKTQAPIGATPACITPYSAKPLSVKFADLKCASQDERANILSEDKYVNEIIKESGHCVMICADSRKHGEILKEKLAAKNKSVEFVDYKTRDTELVRILNDLKAGKLQYIINFRMLGEGFDCPRIDTVVIMRDLYRSNSLSGDDCPKMIERDQIIGRACRLYQGKTCAKVLEIMPDNLDIPSPLPMHDIHKFGIHRIETHEDIGFVGYSLRQWKMQWVESPLTVKNFKRMLMTKSTLSKVLTNNTRLEEIWDQKDPKKAVCDFKSLLSEGGLDCGAIAQLLCKERYTHPKVENSIICDQQFRLKSVLMEKGDKNPSRPQDTDPEIVYALLCYNKNKKLYDFDGISLSKIPVGTGKKKTILGVNVYRHNTCFTIYADNVGEELIPVHATYKNTTEKMAGDLKRDEIYEISRIIGIGDQLYNVAGISPQYYNRLVCNEDLGYSLYKMIDEEKSISEEQRDILIREIAERDFSSKSATRNYINNRINYLRLNRKAPDV